MQLSSKWKNKNFIGSVKCTLNGIKHVMLNERNFKIQLCFAIVAIVCGIVLKISYIEWCIISFAVFFVLVSELFNTAIEKTVDLCTDKYNEIAKVAKDVSSGAVLLAAINSIVIGVIIFLPKIIEFIGK